MSATKNNVPCFRDQVERAGLHKRKMRRRVKGIDGYTKGPDQLQAMPKPGRNDPCACGSGRKSKRCCA